MSKETAIALTHANVHNNAASLRALKRVSQRDKDEIVALNESHRIIPAARRNLKGYRCYTAEPIVKPRVSKPGRRNVSNDTSTWVAKRFEHLGMISQQVSQQWDPASGVAPDRWVVGSAFLGPRDVPIFHLNMHLNAGPEALRGHDAKHPIVREYSESVAWVLDILSTYRLNGFSLMASGDVNMPEGVERPWSIHPRLLRAGMRLQTSGLDLIATEENHFDPVAFATTPAARILSDHPSLHGRYKVKR